MEPMQKRLKSNDLVSLNQNENVPIIRKVNFSFEHNGDASVDQQTTMLVLNLLSKAGRIDTLEVESHSTKTYGCVQFFKPEPADHLLKNREMECGGVQVRLWKATDQPSGEFRIVDVNDDCLQKIFSYLGSSDLKRVTQVNKIFRHNAHAVFAMRNKSIKFSLLLNFATKEYMQNFGYRIKKLEIGNMHPLKRDKPVDNKKSTLLQLIASYCSLTELSLVGLDYRAVKKITQLFPPVLSGLNTLKLTMCSLSHAFIEVLRGCSELTTFHISNCTGNWELPAFNIPKLHSFWHNDVNNNKLRTDVSAMLRNNVQLKKVMISFRYLDNEIMSTIANNLPLVESISISKFGGLQLVPLETENRNALQHLRQIKLGTFSWRTCDYPSSIMEKLAEANIPLERVEILSADIPANNFLNNFPTLKKLYLVGVPSSVATVSLDALDTLQDLRVLVIGKCFAFNDIGLLKLISNNQSLHKINFGHLDFDITVELYEKLVKIVQHRPQKTPIKIVLNDESFQRIDYAKTHTDLLHLTGGGIYDYMVTAEDCL